MISVRIEKSIVKESQNENRDRYYTFGQRQILQLQEYKNNHYLVQKELIQKFQDQSKNELQDFPFQTSIQLNDFEKKSPIQVVKNQKNQNQVLQNFVKSQMHDRFDENNQQKSPNQVIKNLNNQNWIQQNIVKSQVLTNDKSDDTNNQKSSKQNVKYMQNFINNQIQINDQQDESNQQKSSIQYLKNQKIQNLSQQSIVKNQINQNDKFDESNYHKGPNNKNEQEQEQEQNTSKMSLKNDTQNNSSYFKSLFKQSINIKTDKKENYNQTEQIKKQIVPAINLQQIKTPQSKNSDSNDFQQNSTGRFKDVFSIYSNRQSDRSYQQEDKNIRFTQRQADQVRQTITNNFQQKQQALCELSETDTSILPSFLNVDQQPNVSQIQKGKLVQLSPNNNNLSHTDNKIIDEVHFNYNNSKIEDPQQIQINEFSYNSSHQKNHQELGSINDDEQNDDYDIHENSEAHLKVLDKFTPQKRQVNFNVPIKLKIIEDQQLQIKKLNQELKYAQIINLQLSNENQRLKDHVANLTSQENIQNSTFESPIKLQNQQKQQIIMSFNDFFNSSDSKQRQGIKTIQLSDSKTEKY